MRHNATALRHNTTTLRHQDVATRTNICLQSQDLRTTWVGLNERDNVDTVNVAVAPDGTTTADRLIDDSGTGSGIVSYTQNITLSLDTGYVASVFAQAEQLDWFRLVVSAGSTDVNAYFDLANGAVGATTGADNISEIIENKGDGWYRCGIVFTSDAADATNDIILRLADDDNDETVARDGTSSALLWGCQVEVDDHMSPYIPTTTTSASRSYKQHKRLSLRHNDQTRP